MFGYIAIDQQLPPERQERFRAFYCGLCHTLGERLGQPSRLTLSYDLTFLYLLLTALYEPETRETEQRCVPHPLKTHKVALNEFAPYCADMNLLLSYHKVLDDVRDEGRLMARGEKLLLQRAYDSVAEKYPEKCRVVEEALQSLSAKEKEGTLTADEGANATGRMLGAIYRCREDEWAGVLGRLGEGLGRFIYLMDAYDDLESDLKHGQFNPLKEMSQSPDFEDSIREVLRMMAADASEAFEVLPILQDADILRNILYSGCWTRYRLRYDEWARKNGMAPRTTMKSRVSGKEKDA